MEKGIRLGLAERKEIKKGGRIGENDQILFCILFDSLIYFFHKN